MERALRRTFERAPSWSRLTRSAKMEAYHHFFDGTGLAYQPCDVKKVVDFVVGGGEG